MPTAQPLVHRQFHYVTDRLDCFQYPIDNVSGMPHACSCLRVEEFSPPARNPLPVQSDRNGSRFADDGRIRSSTNHLAGYLSLHDQGYRCWWRRRKHHQQNGSGERSLLLCHIMPLSLLLPPPFFATVAAFCYRRRFCRYPDLLALLRVPPNPPLTLSPATPKAASQLPKPSPPLQSHLQNPQSHSRPLKATPDPSKPPSKP